MCRCCGQSACCQSPFCVWLRIWCGCCCCCIKDDSRDIRTPLLKSTEEKTLFVEPSKGLDPHKDNLLGNEEEDVQKVELRVDDGDVSEFPDSSSIVTSQPLPATPPQSHTEQQRAHVEADEVISEREDEEEQTRKMSWMEASDGEEVREVVLTEETLDSVEMYMVGEGAEEVQETVQESVSITVRSENS